MKNLILSMALLLTAGLTQTFAQAHTPQSRGIVTKTQLSQQKRIKQGVKSGELTKKAVFRLEKQQAKIAKTKRLAKSDGNVTCKEKAKITHLQKKASKNIAIKKHNEKNRG